MIFAFEESFPDPVSEVGKYYDTGHHSRNGDKDRGKKVEMRSKTDARPENKLDHAAKKYRNGF